MGVQYYRIFCLTQDLSAKFPRIVCVLAKTVLILSLNKEKEKKMEKNFIYEAPQSQFILFNDTDVISSSGGDLGDWDTDM